MCPYLHTADDAASVDLGGVERLLEVDHGTFGNTVLIGYFYRGER